MVICILDVIDEAFRHPVHALQMLPVLLLQQADVQILTARCQFVLAHLLSLHASLDNARVPVLSALVQRVKIEKPGLEFCELFWLQTF